MFFSFDGIDGVGKTTQLDLFCRWLREQGREVVVCRDPGSTPLGEEVRRILLESGPDTPIGRRAEMLLYMAARAQLVDEVIRPSLDAGKTVVSDRFLLANVVYQGHAGGLNPASIWEIGLLATGGVAPDLTFVLDSPLDVSSSRLARPLDRMEQQGDAFRARLRDGFLAEGRANPERIIVIDSTRSIDDVQAEIRRAAESVLMQN